MVRMDEWLWWMGVVGYAVLIRVTTSLNGYSGKDEPPMYGDLECQRHWMEVTVHTPITEWYVNTTRNDLLYWGLDYPPVAAYMSWVLGQITLLIEPAAITLGAQSRGYATESSVFLMRCFVTVLDVCLFFPACFMVSKALAQASRPRTDEANVFFRLLLWPGFVLIDHGHFQYNCVCLALTLFAISFAINTRPYLSACLFTLALASKQMTLYYALPFFVFLAGHAAQLPPRDGFVRVVILAATVVFTLLALLLPFKHTIPDVLHRLFPLDRGLFEDKVANLWCSISPIWKVQRLARSQILTLSATTTLIGSLPSALVCLRTPSVKSFVSALQNISLAFFLFSYQVHEKTILLVMMTVLLSPTLSRLQLSCLSIAVFSMYPLLQRDGLTIPFFALMAMWTVVTSETSLGSPLVAWQVLSLVGAVLLLLLYHFAAPPARLPDLYTLLITSYSAGHMLLLYAHGFVTSVIALISPKMKTS